MKQGYKNRILSGLIAAALPLFVAVTVSPAAKKKAAEKPRINLTLPRVITRTLGNGLRTFYIRDELPQLTLIASIGYGKLHENSGNAGTSELLARMLVLSGSKKYPGEKLSAAVEGIGGRINIQGSWENIVITVRVLERHSDLAWDVISDLLKNPNFSEPYFSDAKSLIYERIRRRRDNPAELAFEKLRQVIFMGSGYGSISTEGSVRSIALNDLVSLWKSHAAGRNIMFGISGPMDNRTVADIAEKKLGDIQAGTVSSYRINKSAVLTSVKKSSGRIYLIPRPIPQATVVVGTVAPDIKDPCVYPLRIMDYILGGGSFNSRLTREIRVKRGLSYAVQSIIRFRKETGVFFAFAQTRNEQAKTTLSLLLDNISRMAKEPVSSGELSWAIDATINSYIFEFETPLDVLGQNLETAYYGFPSSFLTEYPDRIKKVTIADVAKSSCELFGHGLVSLVVGGEELKKSLASLGEVVVLNPD